MTAASRRRRDVLPLALLAVGAAPWLAAQPTPHASHTASSARDSLAVMATLLGTRVAPALDGRARRELLLTQPMVSVRAGRVDGRIRLAAMLDAERWTMPDGEPVAGIWGEGFMDRRHPHTVLHELMLSGQRTAGPIALSLALGKGFVPFGTDDPMVRPFTKFPANHHLSQVMERVQVVAAVRLTPRLAVEGGVFNGDEPASPTAAPQWTRIGDSRAARLTIWPRPFLELQGSVAAVRSPEFIRPDGLDHEKQSVSARFTPRGRTLQYAHVEWARTTESYRGRRIIGYGTGLAEVAWRSRGWSAAARAEQTTRPEDERLLDPFRTARPPNHLVIKGMTRWRIGTIQLARDLPTVWRSATMLVVEVARAQSSPRLRPVLLDPRDIAGADVAWHLTAGLRLSVGAMAARVGRYGVADRPGPQPMLGMAHSPSAH